MIDFALVAKHSLIRSITNYYLMTYFELYGLPETFQPDLAALRAAYHRLSRETHPDFFGTAPAGEQQAALERATQNTDAYRTLADYDRRVEYILRLHGRLQASDTPALPPDFLMEVMDLNEQVMELQINPDSAAAGRAEAAIMALYEELEASILPTLNAYLTLPEADRPTALDRVLAYYLRRRYVLRLREQAAQLNGQPIA